MALWELVPYAYYILHRIFMLIYFFCKFYIGNILKFCKHLLLINYFHFKTKNIMCFFHIVHVLFFKILFTYNLDLMFKFYISIHKLHDKNFRIIYKHCIFQTLYLSSFSIVKDTNVLCEKSNDWIWTSTNSTICTEAF